MAKDGRSKEIGFWEHLKKSLGIKPENVHAQYTLRTEYYWWILLNTVKGIFEIECPEKWDKDYMLEALLIKGFFGVTETTAGVLPLKCGLTGVNCFNRPTKAVFANPVLGNFNREIDKDCVIVSLHGSGFRRGIVPIINETAEKLASCDGAIDVNLINSKTAHVFGAASKKEAESLKAMMDEISRGEPAVFVQDTIVDKLGTSFFKTDVKQNFVADVIQIEKRKILEEFLTQFGINNANTDKRERLNADEVNSNNMELLVNTQYWYNNLQEACDKVNKMYPGMNFHIRMPYRDKEEQRFSSEVNSSESEQKGANDENS